MQSKVNNIRIYVVTHKQFCAPKKEIYIPIVAGACEHMGEPIYDLYLRDNTYKNISNKHNLYSEFTVFYWVANNTKYDIVGINHYRRYFIKGSWFNYIKCLLSNSIIDSYLLDEKYINGIFDRGYDCIMPKKIGIMPYTLLQYFCKCIPIGESLFKEVRRIIEDMYASYVFDFDKVINSRFNYYKCINIMKKELFKELVEWQYDILSKVEFSNIELKDRYCAYISEVLIGVFVSHHVRLNHIKVKELFFVNTEYRRLSTKVSSEYIYPMPVYCLLFIVGIAKRTLRKFIGRREDGKGYYFRCKWFCGKSAD